MPYGLFGSALPSFHRMPSLSAILLPIRVAGPLRLSAQIGLARFGPLSGSIGDEGADGIGPGERGWRVADLGERDGVWEPGERLAAFRLAARAYLQIYLAMMSGGGAILRFLSHSKLMFWFSLV